MFESYIKLSTVSTYSSAFINISKLLGISLSQVILEYSDLIVFNEIKEVCGTL